MQPTPQDDQLTSKNRVLSFQPPLRLKWRGQDRQNATKKPDHFASLSDSITSSTQIRFWVHTGSPPVFSFELYRLPSQPTFLAAVRRAGSERYSQRPAAADVGRTSAQPRPS